MLLCIGIIDIFKWLVGNKKYRNCMIKVTYLVQSIKLSCNLAICQSQGNLLGEKMVVTVSLQTCPKLYFELQS
jgi:hypothetical protein